MATYAFFSEPQDGGKIEIYNNGEKQIPDKNYFHCSGFDKITFNAIPEQGYVFSEFRMDHGHHGTSKENPLTLNLPFGTTVTAYFKLTDEERDWRNFLETEERKEKEDKNAALRQRFEASRKEKTT